MLVGTQIDKIWDFAKKQRFFLQEVILIIEKSDIINYDIDTLIKLDERYIQLGKNFKGPIFFSHIIDIIPITNEASQNIGQLVATFPEVKKFMRLL